VRTVFWSFWRVVPTHFGRRPCRPPWAWTTSSAMFLRSKRGVKNGKWHRYWSVVERCTCWPGAGIASLGACHPSRSAEAAGQRAELPEASAGQPERAAAEDRGVAVQDGTGQAVREDSVAPRGQPVSRSTFRCWLGWAGRRALRQLEGAYLLRGFLPTRVAKDGASFWPTHLRAA
jgi:hypothetical protein